MGIWQPYKYEVPEFGTFERFVLEWLPQQQLKGIDFVFRPQVEFAFDERDAQIVDYIGRLESIGDAVDHVGRRTAIDIQLGHKNRTGAVGDYRRHYTNDEMIDIIGRVYSKDVATFGYHF
jgi:hypothetical protein